PARPYKPRDKAKVEVGVQVVQRWILARLRNRRFFSLGELNQAIRELVDQLNDRPMRGWGATRRALYEQVDRPALRELPPTAYEYADWKRCRVNLDYHVEIDKHFYSVPFRLLREEVEARITAKTVEIFHRGKLVAAHLRSLRPYRPTTLADHMPSGWMLPARERWHWAPARTARSRRSLGMLRTGSRASRNSPACCTRTSAVLTTTIERREDADPPSGRAPARPRHGRHGRCVHSDAEQHRCHRPHPRGLARPAARPRSDRARQQAAWPTAAPGAIAPERCGRRHRLPHVARSGPSPVP